LPLCCTSNTSAALPFSFITSLAAFTLSLVDFAREVRIALSEFDHYG
jgi:hypothetical protein